jgi:hypothetical protein
MSKITNIRLPSSGTNPNYSPVAFNQALEAVQQIVRQLNSTYTPQATENTRGIEDWMTGAVGPISRSTLEDRGVFAFGSFYDTTNQTVATADTATAITWNSTAYSKHISVGSPTSRIVFSKAGTYWINFTAQLHSESANDKTFYFWPRINGVDIPGSTMIDTLHNNDSRQVTSRAGIFQVDKGDYLEAMWAADDTDADLHGLAATAFCPATPSVTLQIQGLTYG